MGAIGSEGREGKGKGRLERYGREGRIGQSQEEEEEDGEAIGKEEEGEGGCRRRPHSEMAADALKMPNRLKRFCKFKYLACFPCKVLTIWQGNSFNFWLFVSRGEKGQRFSFSFSLFRPLKMPFSFSSNLVFWRLFRGEENKGEESASAAVQTISWGGWNWTRNRQSKSSTFYGFLHALWMPYLERGRGKGGRRQLTAPSFLPLPSAVPLFFILASSSAAVALTVMSEYEWAGRKKGYNGQENRTHIARPNSAHAEETKRKIPKQKEKEPRREWNCTDAESRTSSSFLLENSIFALRHCSGKRRRRVE